MTLFQQNFEINVLVYLFKCFVSKTRENLQACRLFKNIILYINSNGHHQQLCQYSRAKRERHRQLLQEQVDIHHGRHRVSRQGTDREAAPLVLRSQQDLRARATQEGPNARPTPQ